MAISYKSDKDYGFSLLPLFGVSSSLISDAKKAGVSVEQHSPGTFLIQLNGTTYGSVSVKGTAISLAKSKTLGPASKEALKFQFEGGIKKALAAANSVNVEVVEDTWPTPPIKAAVQQSNTSPVWKDAFKPTPIGKFDKSNPEELLVATKLYQPIKGTTSGSVYFLLSIFKGLNIAARIQGSKLSIRAEGASLGTYKSALEDLGMEMKGGYASAHYEAHGESLMIKTLGALIGRVGYENALSLPDLKKFVGGQ
jgi:hypothetical protein